jgi:hypothetical protein
VSIAVRAPKEGTVLVDAATGKPPTDPDAVFEKVTPYGTARRCRVRLHQIAHRGPHAHRTEHLILPVGQVVNVEKAGQILAVLRRQLDDADTEG